LFLCLENGLEPGFRKDCLAENGPFYLSGGVSGEEMSRQAGFIVFAPGNPRLFDAWKTSKSGNRPEGYARLKTEKLASIWNTVVGRCPELAEAEILAGATPLTNRDFLESPGCGLYGAKHSLHQFSPLPITRIPNLWMAGQSVIAPGVLGAIISGVVACGAVLGLEAMHREVAACA
jgi:all-trans-retinol 13,14-reductase